MLHDKDNQDEGFTNISMPWKNPGLRLNLPSMLCVIKTLESVILCFSMQMNVLWCKWLCRWNPKPKGYVKMKMGGQFLGYDSCLYLIFSDLNVWIAMVFRHSRYERIKYQNIENFACWELVNVMWGKSIRKLFIGVMEWWIGW